MSSLDAPASLPHLELKTYLPAFQGHAAALFAKESGTAGMNWLLW
jgi:hypothetical protein